MDYYRFVSFLGLCIIGLTVRVVFLNSPLLTKSLGNRNEISTPLTAWKRAIEGVSLQKQGVNPYTGDAFHESPLALLFYEYILSNFQKWISVIFAVSDLLTAVALSLAGYICLNYMKKMEDNTKFPESAQPLLLKSDEMKWVPIHITALYLFCPYSIASCAGKSTVVFQNTIISFFILSTVSGKWLAASIFLAFASYHSFYHISLLVPLVMFTHQRFSTGGNEIIKIMRLFTVVFVFLTTVAILLYASHEVTGSWNFLTSTYGSLLTVQDLTPNIGLFWYFFTEMFEHFREFFIVTFQLNVFVYTVPLAIRLRKEPMLMLVIQLMIITVFKSYPCIGDVALYLSLLPIWSHMYHFFRQRFIIGCILASATVLAPTLWYLWIYAGSANANFYFAIALVFSAGEIFLLTDLLTAFIRREYYLEHGVKYTEDGKLLSLNLQWASS